MTNEWKTDLSKLEKLVWVHTREDAKRFLRIKGTKVAIQVGHEGEYVFANKSDFIKQVVEGDASKHYDRFVDYDGNPEPVFADNGVLHVPIGVS